MPIRPIYTAASAEAAEAELDAFADGPWGQKFPTVVSAWRRAWSNVIPFFAFPPAVRRVIYTTNSICPQSSLFESCLMLKRVERRTRRRVLDVHPGPSLPHLFGIGIHRSYAYPKH